MIDPNCEFDFTRNDKFYELTIPTYSHIGDSVFYEVHLRDLVQNLTYVHSFRFKQLKEYHEELLQLKLELPEFPRTHFWKKTNKNPKMIQERKETLQLFFNVVINDPFTRGYKHVKKFIRICKLGSQRARSFSQRRCTSTTGISRVKSQEKNNKMSTSIRLKPLKASINRKI